MHVVNSLRKVDVSGLLLIQVLLQFDSRKRQLTLHVLVGWTVCISSCTRQYKGRLVENGAIICDGSSEEKVNVFVSVWDPSFLWPD